MKDSEVPGLPDRHLAGDGSNQQPCDLLSKILRMVFEQAYLLGRKDAMDGFQIDPGFAFEQFTQQRCVIGLLLPNVSADDDGRFH